MANGGTVTGVDVLNIAYTRRSVMYYKKMTEWGHVRPAELHRWETILRNYRSDGLDSHSYVFLLLRIDLLFGIPLQYAVADRSSSRSTRKQLKETTTDVKHIRVIDILIASGALCRVCRFPYHLTSYTFKVRCVVLPVL